ncbi:hypothetical protein PIB30_023558 [Stylosanthes scabra]|uniref:Uncharacterized protein n=1 Tax=Stylosanthes scabra TaxID=79078 RepID=A0ABU6W956_9FABA|nr:hypothetical protein [Stylosanthes scabra]
MGEGMWLWVWSWRAEPHARMGWHVMVPGLGFKRSCSICPLMVVYTLSEPLRDLMVKRGTGPCNIPDVIEPSGDGGGGGVWGGDGQGGDSSPNDSNWSKSLTTCDTSSYLSL